MKFLADQDVYAITTNFIRSLGHDVVTANELGLARSKDIELLQRAQSENRIIVTRDRDFGALVFAQGSGPGVIYLRVLPSTVAAIHAELQRVLELYEESKLLISFVVVEPARHRLRQLT